MRERKIVQLVIYPKIFSVVSFYAKGQYALSISVKQQFNDGSIVEAYPTMVRRTDINLPDSKKPHTKINEKKAQFISEQFYVTYNQQTVMMNTLAVFKLEIDPKQPSQFYVDFKLVLNKQKKVGKGQGNDGKNSSAQRVMTTVDSRRVRIRKINELDQFKRIIFSQCQYFSFLDVYFGSVQMGTKFRIHNQQLAQFSNLDPKLKVNLQAQCHMRKLALIAGQKGELIQRQVNMSVTEFRQKYGSQAYCMYTSVRKRLIHLIKIAQDQSSSWFIEPQIRAIMKNQIHFDTLLKSRKQLQKMYEVSSTQDLYYQIYKEICELDLYTRHIWNKFLSTIHKIPLRFYNMLARKHLMRENSLKQLNMIVHGEISMSRQSQQQIFIKRRKQVLSHMEICEDDDIYHPLIMVEGFEDVKNQSPPSLQIDSLVVFVHGYQGSDYDLEKAKNFLTLYGPNSHGLLIKSIQDQIDESLQYLGAKVAGEVKAHITGTFNVYKKINFIGYSLGGVIIRQCLKHLNEYKSKMNLFATFASPHLGVTQSDSKLVGTGIWYLINFQKVKNLKQLNCQQDDKQEVILGKLSQCECLSWFKKVIFVSSKQDNFVPHYSSRVDPTINDPGIREMANNMLKLIKKTERMELWFDVQHNIGTFDKILGRRAHIQFLQNRIFLDLFFRLYGAQL